MEKTLIKVIIIFKIFIKVKKFWITTAIVITASILIWYYIASSNIEHLKEINQYNNAYNDLKENYLDLIDENNYNRMMLDSLYHNILQQKDKIISLKYKIYELSRGNHRLITELSARKESWEIIKKYLEE